MSDDWHSVDLLLGFMTKIKKLLETVCHNCGKIKLDEVSHPCWMANLVFIRVADVCHNVEQS